MKGHGHVVPNPDGSKAKCGGPSICPECSREFALYYKSFLDSARTVFAGDTIAALKAQLAEARAVLTELERIFRLRWDHCPWCLVPEGHAPDCRLAKFLETP